MNKLFIKDTQNNLWSLDKVVGLVKQVNPEDETDMQYIAVLEGGMSTMISAGMFYKLSELLIILEIEDNSEGE